MVTSFSDIKRPPYGIIAILMVGAFITFLNNTLLNIALPPIMTEMKVGPSAAQWVTTGYMLVNGIMIPTTAFLIEKYSVRRLFLVATGIFSIGTMLAGVTPFFSLLIIARMVQAIGGAIMMPLLMNVLLVSFPIEKRGTVMGIFGFILMFAPAIGPTLSGFIIEQFHWRALFFLIAPVAVIVFINGFFLLKDHKHRPDLRLDKLSLLLSSIGFGSLLFGFSMAGEFGWFNPFVFFPIVLGVFVLLLFSIRQVKLEKPMLNFAVFQYPMYNLSLFIIMVVQIAMFSGVLLIPIYVQMVLGVMPMQAGLLMLPGALVNAVMSPINGKLFDRFGGRILAVIGLTVITLSTFYFSQLTVNSHPYAVMILHTIRMFGMSMVMMPVQTNGLNQLPRKLYPHGTAMNNTLIQVTAALGTGLMITIMRMKEKSSLQSFSERYGNFSTLSPELQERLTIQAMVEGINAAFFVSALFALLALIFAFFMKRAYPDEYDASGKATELKKPLSSKSLNT